MRALAEAYGRSKTLRRRGIAEPGYVNAVGGGGRIAGYQAVAREMKRVASAGARAVVVTAAV
jgi:hypothetical protein